MEYLGLQKFYGGGSNNLDCTTVFYSGHYDMDGTHEEAYELQGTMTQGWD